MNLSRNQKRRFFLVSFETLKKCHQWRRFPFVAVVGQEPKVLQARAGAASLPRDEASAVLTSSNSQAWLEASWGKLLWVPRLVPKTWVVTNAKFCSKSFLEQNERVQNRRLLDCHPVMATSQYTLKQFPLLCAALLIFLNYSIFLAHIFLISCCAELLLIGETFLSFLLKAATSWHCRHCHGALSIQTRGICISSFRADLFVRIY